MGTLISYMRKNITTIERLEKIDKDIIALERKNRGTLERQKRLIGALIVYSIIGYMLAAVAFYFYRRPENLVDHVLYVLPLLVFPIVVWILKRIMKWYFVKRISSYEEELLLLRESKESILENVMEHETYKKAKEILDKFSPEMHRKYISSPDTKPLSRPSSRADVRRRSTATKSLSKPQLHPTQQQQQQQQQPAMATPTSNTTQAAITSTVGRVTASQPNVTPMYAPTTPAYRRVQSNPVLLMPGGKAPGPPAPRNIPPRERSTLELLFEYMIGESHTDRFALICFSCNSHNGMVSAEQFDYTAFRCCYCYCLNESEKQRPIAPLLHEDKPVTSANSDAHYQQQPLPASKPNSDSEISTTTAAPVSEASGDVEDSAVSDSDGDSPLG